MPRSARPSFRRCSLPTNCSACPRCSKFTRLTGACWLPMTGAAGLGTWNVWKSEQQGLNPMNHDITPWLEKRNKLGINQTDFWKKVAVTQSGGSRYETGRSSVPSPVRLLLRIAYGTAKQSDAAVDKLRAPHAQARR